MHFHFIVRRETLFTLNCILRHTLVPVCHKWLCLVEVIPGGRAEVTRWSCTDRGCELNTPWDGAGLQEHACLVFSDPGCTCGCSYSHIRRVVLLLPLVATLYPRWAQAANASLPYVVHRSWFRCLFSLHSSVAVSTRQHGTWHLCWQRNVLRMSVRKCKKQKIFSQLFSRASLPAWGDHMACIHP